MNVFFNSPNWQLVLGILLIEMVLCLALILLVRLLFRRVMGPTGCCLLWVVLIVRCLVPISIPTQHHPVAYFIAAGNVSDRFETVASERLPTISPVVETSIEIAQTIVTTTDASIENNTDKPVFCVPGGYFPQS